mmetsp:Transcript_49181/g.73330  ORF Transcript_49181/g.73330 Transcript_49181/m.73330 type:complete len:205 (+) Transcript_49181:475-1089(+)
MHPHQPSCKPMVKVKVGTGCDGYQKQKYSQRQFDQFDQKNPSLNGKSNVESNQYPNTWYQTTDIDPQCTWPMTVHVIQTDGMFEKVECRGVARIETSQKANSNPRHVVHPGTVVLVESSHDKEYSNIQNHIRQVVKHQFPPSKTGIMFPSHRPNNVKRQNNPNSSPQKEFEKPDTRRSVHDLVTPNGSKVFIVANWIKKEFCKS